MAAWYCYGICQADAVDLPPTPEQQAFRAEVRTWLMENLPWDYGHGLPPRFEDLGAEVAFLRRWQASLASGGWVGVAWPLAWAWPGWPARWGWVQGLPTF